MLNSGSSTLVELRFAYVVLEFIYFISEIDSIKTEVLKICHQMYMISYHPSH